MHSKPLFSLQITFPIYSRIRICAAFSEFCRLHPTAFPTSVRFTGANSLSANCHLFCSSIFSDRFLHPNTKLFANLVRSFPQDGGWRGEDASHSLGGEVNKVRNNLWPNVLSAPRSGGQPNLLRDQSRRGCAHLFSWTPYNICSCYLGNAENPQEDSSRNCCCG